MDISFLAPEPTKIFLKNWLFVCQIVYFKKVQFKMVNILMKLHLKGYGKKLPTGGMKSSYFSTRNRKM
jgi:hypothetical protein